MYRILWLVVFALCVSSSQGIAADPFAGKWINSDEKTDGTTRLEIKEEGDGWVIQAWGRCHPADCDCGKMPLHVLGETVSDKDMKYGLAQWDHRFADVHMTLHRKEGELVAETFTVFKDGSGRSNYRHKESFKQAE